MILSVLIGEYDVLDIVIIANGKVQNDMVNLSMKSGVGVGGGYRISTCVTFYKDREEINSNYWDYWMDMGTG